MNFANELYEAVNQQNLKDVKDILSRSHLIKDCNSIVLTAITRVSKLGRRNRRPSRTSLDILQILVDNGLRFDYSSMPVDRFLIFNRVRNSDAIKLILDAGFLLPVKPLLSYAYKGLWGGRIIRPHANLMLELARRGCLPNGGFESKKCVAALCWLICYTPFNTTRKLLEFGFRPHTYINAEKRMKYDPLYGAIVLPRKRKSRKLVDLLLAYGAVVTQITFSLFFALYENNTYILISLLAKLRDQGRHEVFITVGRDGPIDYEITRLYILSNVIDRYNYKSHNSSSVLKLMHDDSFPTLFDLITHDLALQDRLYNINKLKK